MSAKKIPIPERFWSKVDQSGGPDACWPWTAAKQGRYGTFAVTAKQMRGAHRVALELTTGKRIPPGMHACHRCDNPPCCNPAHLFVGTPRDNERDKSTKGRSARGESNGGGGKLSESDVIHIRRARQDGALLRELAASFSISENMVSQIVNLKAWQHVKDDARHA